MGKLSPSLIVSLTTIMVLCLYITEVLEEDVVWKQI